MNDHAISVARSLRADPHPTPDYQPCHTPHDLTDYVCASVLGPLACLGCDTESLPDNTCYCVTISHTPGTGRLVYTSDIATLSWLREWLRNRGTDNLIFHNYLHDVIPFDALSLPIQSFTDTMIQAYHLCLGGGGDDDDTESKAGRGSLSLKTLAYRHLNMQMTSFRDTVYPHSIPHLTAWLHTATTALSPLPPVKLCICGHETPYHAQRGKTMRHTGPCSKCDCRRHKLAPKPEPSISDKPLKSLYTKSSNLLNKITAHPDTDWADSKNDPWKLVKSWEGEGLDTLELVAGKLPVPSIAHVPEPELLQYACRDADATLRLHLYMRDLKPWLFWP